MFIHFCKRYLYIWEICDSQSFPIHKTFKVEFLVRCLVDETNFYSNSIFLNIKKCKIISVVSYTYSLRQMFETFLDKNENLTKKE